MECFVIIVNGWKPLTIITKHSILDVAAALDPPLIKHKLRTILGVIRNLVLDFIFYFVTAYMKKNPIHVTSGQGATQNALHIT